MRNRLLARNTLVFGALALMIATLPAQTPPAASGAANPRFAKWKLKSDNPNSSNIMTYEPYNGTGMKVTIDSVNASGAKSSWGYNTMLDGKPLPLTGQAGRDAASVRVINDKINEIIYTKEGKFVQLLLNVLSADNNSILVTYLSTNSQGVTNVTYATYERMK